MVTMVTGTSHPVLEVSLAGMEMKYCKTDAAQAVTGTMSAVQAMLVHRGQYLFLPCNKLQLS